MVKIKLVSILFFLFAITSFAQKSLNEYKYIIVPSQYEFQKSEDVYKINSLTKFLFNKAGFTTFLSNEDFPQDLAQNRCLALTAKLKNGKGLFKTKMNFDLVNCNNKVVFSTRVAETKEKDYKKAYHQVIRKTLQDLKTLNYKYQPKVVDEVAEVEQVKDIKVIEKLTKVEDSTHSASNQLLYAQPIQNGFQLVDMTPKRMYIIKKTSVKDVFILDDKNGILYKFNDKWIAEYYEGNTRIKKELNIKF